MTSKFACPLLLLVVILTSYVSDVSAEPRPDYYDAAAGKSGADLKAALHSIIDDHIRLPYTSSGNDLTDGKDLDVWEALLFTDSACNAINPTCGDVQLLYLGLTRNVSDRNQGRSAPDSWDREHVFPKSYGFEGKSQYGYTDLHHLRPADRTLNGYHSNYPYCQGGEPLFDKHNDGSFSPTSAKYDSDRKCFEPTDIAKGQVARMVFYMAVRYEPEDTEPENMPDLEVVSLEEISPEGGLIGDLCTLVQWNRLYLPSDFERLRNDRIEYIQGNRNPFVDHPEWVDVIWEPQCN